MTAKLSIERPEKVAVDAKIDARDKACEKAAEERE